MVDSNMDEPRHPNGGPSDAEDIAAARAAGYYTVIAYDTPPRSVPSDPYVVLRVLRDASGNPVRFQTQQRARQFAEACYDIEESQLEIMAPEMGRDVWHAAMMTFVCDMAGLDAEDATSLCNRFFHQLETLRAAGDPPALAAARFSAFSSHFDFEAWQAAHLPQESREPEPPAGPTYGMTR